MKDYPEFFETMLNLNNISLIDFKKLEIEKRIYFHQEVNYAILKVIANYFEKDSRGNDIKEILSYQESMLFDFDPFSYYASLEGIKESDIKTS